MPDPREPLGRLVHDTWVAWAMEQPGAKPSWLVTWDQLPEDDPQREVDMRIGAAVAVQAVADAKVEVDKMRATVMAAHSELARLRDRCDERDRLISALIAEHPVELGRFSRMLSDAALGQERREEGSGNG